VDPVDPEHWLKVRSDILSPSRRLPHANLLGRLQKWTPKPKICKNLNSNLTPHSHSYQGVTKRCRLSWLTNSALVYEPQMQEGRVLRGLGQREQLCTWSQNKLNNNLYNNNLYNNLRRSNCIFNLCKLVEYCSQKIKLFNFFRFEEAFISGA
jgi:hypothetical protein